jgi:hypothetical protein
MYFEFDGRPQPEVFKTETLIELNKKATRLSCFPQTANSVLNSFIRSHIMTD